MQTRQNKSTTKTVKSLKCKALWRAALIVIKCNTKQLRAASFVARNTDKQGGPPRVSDDSAQC